MPDTEKTTRNPAAWDQWDAVGRAQAVEANTVHELLRDRLARPRTHAERVEAFRHGYQHVAEWVRRTFADQTGSSPMTAEEAGAAIDTRRGYRVSPSVEDHGTPAYSTYLTFHNLAMARLDGAEVLQNVVNLRYGREVYGNQLIRIPEGQAAYPLQAGEVMTVTAAHEERALLRNQCFVALADLEAKRTEPDGPQPTDPRNRQA